jgi:hypothetical protein
MVQAMSYPSVSAMKRSLHSVDAELWFPEDALEYPDFGADSATSGVEENLDDLLIMVESVDADDGEESLKPGIGVENFCESSSFQQHEKCPLTPINHFSGRPKTPPTTKPSFNELPPIISPDLYMERDSATSSPLNEAFQPPRGHHHFQHMTATRQHHRRGPPNAYERSLLDKLAHSMRRSHASRREIIRRRHFFGHHPSLYEIERLENSHRRIWSFVASQQGFP